MPDIVPCTEVHPLPDGAVHLLGAVRQVTGAMTRVDTGGKSILVDCGISQGRDATHGALPDEAKSVDAVVLTHGHQDHIGRIPDLLESGYEGPIFATSATLDIAKISLEDSLEMNRVPHSEVRRTLARFQELARPIPYERSSALGGWDGTFTFREAGHILGSASLEIATPKSRVILSGDLGRPNSPILRDPNTVWDGSRPVDVVVMESTYGSREHAHSHNDIEQDLERILKEAIAHKGKVLIPAFAIGRTQVLLYFINALVESGRIPAIPVAIDTPMGLAITETYDKFHKLFDKESLDLLAHGDDPLDFENLFSVKKGAQSAKLGDLPGPMIIIAGSGMCVGGRIMGHLKRGLPSHKTTVLFVGYQAPGTNGRRIQDAAKNPGSTVRIDGEDVEVRANVATLKGLSAHADRKELRAWLGHIPNAKRVALHHGDVEAQEGFAAWMKT